MHRLTGYIDRLLDSCCSVLRVVAGLLMLGIVALSLCNLGLRITHHQEIASFTGWSEVLFVWMCFAGFYVIHHTRRDICIEYFVNKLGGAGRVFVRLIRDVVVLLVSGTILWQAPKIVELQQGAIDLVGIPKYDEALLLFLVVGLIALDASLDLYRLAARRMSPGTAIAWQE